MLRPSYTHWLKPLLQSPFLVQHISVASWCPGSSTGSCLMTIHGTFYLLSPPRLVCDPHSACLRGVPNYLPHSSPSSSSIQCFLLQGIAETSLSWERAAALQEGPPSHSTGQLPWSQAEQGSLLLTSPDKPIYTTDVNSQNRYTIDLSRTQKNQAAMKKNTLKVLRNLLE